MIIRDLAGEHQVIAGGHRVIAGEHRVVAGEHRVIAGEHRVIAGGRRVIAGEHRVIAGEHHRFYRNCFSINKLRFLDFCLFGELQPRDPKNPNLVNN